MTDKRLAMPTSVAQIAMHFQLDGQPCENVFYVQKMHRDTGLSAWVAAAFDSGESDTVNGLLTAWLTGSWAPNANQDAACVGTDIVWNTGVGTGPLEGRTYTGSPYPISGTLTGEAFPNNTTIAISFRTALLGRSFHGRLYYVGISREQVDAAAPNVLKPSASVSLQAAYEGLRSSLGASIGIGPMDKTPLGVVSFVHAGAPRSPAVFNEVTTVTLTDNYLDSQRRRLPGHNRHH